MGTFGTEIMIILIFSLMKILYENALMDKIFQLYESVKSLNLSY